jgi:hypothetical protein
MSDSVNEFGIIFLKLWFMRRAVSDNYPPAMVPFFRKLFRAKSKLTGTKGVTTNFARISRGENVQNLFHVFRHQRQMALARVKGSVAVWNGRGHVAAHGERGIGVRLAMPKVNC